MTVHKQPFYNGQSDARLTETKTQNKYINQTKSIQPTNSLCS